MKERVLYVDFLRIFAAFAVIFIHICSIEWYTSPPSSLNWQVLNIYDSFARWSVPVFIMISGMFFLNPEKKISTKVIYSKYLFKILCIFIFWSLFYCALSYYNNFLDPDTILIIIKRILFSEPWYHFWFLYTIAGLYILTPIIKIFINGSNRKNIEYFLILFIIFGMFIPFLNHYLFIINPDNNLKINLNIIELQGFLGYYIAGYYFSKYDLKNINRKLIYIMGILSIIITIVATSIISINNNKADGFLYGYILPNTALPAFAIFLFFKNNFNNIKVQNIKKLTFISETTLGIYLIHPFFIHMMRSFKMNISIIFYIPLFSIIIFLLSIFTIMIMKKIPIIKKYVV